MSQHRRVPPPVDGSTDAASPPWPRRIARFMRRFPWICAALSATIGAFTLLGWFLQRPEWTTVLPGLPPMEANTAVMALLAGLSLVLLAPTGASGTRVFVGRIVAGVVLGLAIMPLVEHLFGVDLAVDRVLASQSESLFHHPPGRPSPQTATAFALIGIALLSLDAKTKRGRHPATALALLAALIPLIALLAYVFGTAELYGAQALYPYIGMGLPTAVALLALSAGALAARAGESPLSVLMRNDSGGLAARQLVAWLLLLAAATCGIEAGARFGLSAAPIGGAGVMLVGIIGGSAFVLRVSHRLSHLDAAAQHAIRARDDVMGVVALDLGNPLSVILMHAELLRMIHQNGDHQTDQAAAAISRSATRMNRLIQDLLDVSRIDAGGLSLARAPIDPAKFLAESVESQRPLASSEQLDLRLDIEPPLPQVDADRDRLAQVLENLIGNAIKFTEPGGRITVGARSRDEGVLFWVSDAGVGIRDSDLPQVFDRFWQAEGESSAARGTGLGLPIVKGIVEAHGGRVWVESTPGRGTTVSFVIPGHL